MEKLSKELEELGNDPEVLRTESLQSKFTDDDWDALGNVKRLPEVTPESKLNAYESMMVRGVSPDDLSDLVSRKEYQEYLSSERGKADYSAHAKYLHSLNT